jgi:hypothetical protein
LINTPREDNGNFGSTLPILAEDFTARMAGRLGDERGHSDLGAGE